MPVQELEHILSGLTEENYASAVKYIVYLNDTQLTDVSDKPDARRIGLARGEFSVPDDIDFCNDEVAALFGAA